MVGEGGRGGGGGGGSYIMAIIKQAFAWAKMKIMYYLETIAAIGLKVGLNIQITEFMKFNEYQRSRSLFDLGQRSLRFQN